MKEILFAERLKKLRQKEGITQVELSNATGISQSAITAWEVGTNLPTANALIILAEYFGVSTDYLLGVTDKMN